MHLKTFLTAAAPTLALLAPAVVEASGHEQKGHAGQHGQRDCCTAPCCQARSGEPDAAEVLWEMDPQLNPAPPVKQTAEVWFRRPVLVGRAILQGRYVIEHDNDRAARGEPCSHVYAYHDQRTPVAVFDCTHLERDRAASNAVVLTTIADGSMQRLTEFQFAGEHFAHGYPPGR